jgi:hypothetical protein
VAEAISIKDRVVQEIADRFYFANGPCCSGCDWWRHVNSIVGECTRSAPVSGDQRGSMLGMRSTSLVPIAGHILTPRTHHCGEFKDEFDWDSLPAAYLQRIGR